MCHNSLLTYAIPLVCILHSPLAAQENVPSSPEDGGPRSWTVATEDTPLLLRESPSRSAKISARLSPGTQLSNLGCRAIASGIWCDVQAITGGPRGFVSYDYIEPTIGPDGSVPMGLDNSSYRAGQKDFDATGAIPCAQDQQQPATRCAFGVSRSNGGYATVVVYKSDGRERVIYFSVGIPTGVNSSEAYPAGEIITSKRSDINIINVGEERYEIPDAVVNGG